MEVIDFGKHRINAIISTKQLEKNLMLDTYSSLYKNVSSIYKMEDIHNTHVTVKDLLNSNSRRTHSLKRCKDALIMMNLSEDLLERELKTLSTSELSKVIIASTLIQNKSILIFNNPTIGLNHNDKNNFIKLIRMLKNRYNKTIIISSNDVDFLYRICDYFYYVDDDKLVYEGSKEDFFTKLDLMKKYKISLPKILKFINKVRIKKKIRLIQRIEINDLIKDIYRNKN